MLLHFNKGEWITVNDAAKFAFQNTAFLQGLGLIETMRINNCTIPLSVLHYQRLVMGLKILDWEIPSLDSWNGLLQIGLKQHQSELNYVLRFQFFQGTADKDLFAWLSLPAMLTVPEHVSLGFYTEGVKEHSLLSACKHSSRSLFSLAFAAAKKQGHFDLLVKNNGNQWVETAICNVFWAKDKIVYTPHLEEGCTAGIMREYVMKLVQEQGIPFVFAPLSTEAFPAIDEVFITNAVKGVVPVNKIGDKTYETHIGKALQSMVELALFA